MDTQRNTTKKAFEHWINDYSIKNIIEINDEDVTEALKNIGISNINVYDETNPIIIRLYISELVTKREKYGIESIRKYLNTINQLILYSEFLDDAYFNIPNSGMNRNSKGILINENISNATSTPKNLERDYLADSLTIAYYLSRINTKAVKDLGYKTFQEAFNELSKILGQKPATIKNMRDQFDPYFDNGRVGWYQQKLSPSRKKIFEQFKHTDDEELTALVNKILNSYIPNEEMNQKSIENSHVRLKISNDDMKIIKSKK